jgi:hypothetical protein
MLGKLLPGGTLAEVTGKAIVVCWLLAESQSSSVAMHSDFFSLVFLE